MADFGVEQPAGPSDPVSATVDAAKAAGLAYVQQIEQPTHTAGDAIGAGLPVAPSPDRDTSVLTAGPGAY